MVASSMWGIKRGGLFIEEKMWLLISRDHESMNEHIKFCLHILFWLTFITIL